MVDQMLISRKIITLFVICHGSLAYFDSLRNSYNALRDTAASGYNSLKDKAASGYNAVSDSVAGGYNAMKDKAASGYNSMRSGVAGGYNAMSDKVSGGYNAMRSGMAGGYNAVSDRVSGGYNAMRDGAANAYNTIRDNAPGFYRGKPYEKNSGYKTLKQSTLGKYVDPYVNRYWPKDSAGADNADPICPIGYTCTPNYFKDVLVQQKPKILQVPHMANRKYKQRIYSPKNFPGGGCMGLEQYKEVALQSMHNDLYLAPCRGCFTARYKKMAMVYTRFDNPNAKWRFIESNGKCAIKNVKSGRYLSVCRNCTAAISFSLLSVSKRRVNKNTNNELWEVARNPDNTYAIKSVSTGTYLSICENCLSEMASVTSPAALLKTSPTNSFAKWWVRATKKDRDEVEARRIAMSSY